MYIHTYTYIYYVHIERGMTLLFSHVPQNIFERERAWTFFVLVTYGERERVMAYFI
jgi:hypothetical protein